MIPMTFLAVAERPREGCFAVGRVYKSLRQVLLHPTPPLGRSSGRVALVTCFAKERPCK